MKPVTGKKLAKALERNGWELLRISGSHHIYGKEGSVVRISVPMHGSKPLRIGLAKHLLSMAGLKESDLG